MKSIILLFALASTCLALTPTERQLVSGLNTINQDLRAQVADNEAKISQKDTDYIFLNQKNDSLSGLLKTANDKEKQQTQDLLLAQGKIKAIENERDQAITARDAALKEAAKWKVEAHRNAVERDLCLFAFAIVGTVLVMTYSGYIIGWLCKIWPALAPFGIGIEIALAIISFTAIYGAGRGVLALIYSHL